MGDDSLNSRVNDIIARQNKLEDILAALVKTSVKQEIYIRIGLVIYMAQAIGLDNAIKAGKFILGV